MAVIDPNTDEGAEFLNLMRTGVSAQFATSSKTTKAPTKEVGVDELESDGSGFTAPKIDADLIYNLRHNVYASGVIRKLIRLVFQSKEKFTIEVFDTKTNKKDDELSAKFMRMAERTGVRLWVQMKKQLISNYYWGIYVSNAVWGKDEESGDTDIQLLKIRHLHSYTFKTAPPGALKTYSDLLPGITLNEKSGDMEFHQEPEPGVTPILIKKENIFWAKDPSDDGLTGDPLVIPIIPVIEMLKFVWNAEMQHCNRVGAGGNLLLKVSHPQTAAARNSSKSDMEVANAIIQKWSKQTGLILRDNMEPVDPKTRHDTNNLEIIDALTNVLTEYITLSSYMSSGQQTRLGGNEKSQKELLDNSIINLQQTIAEQWEILFMRYFEYNGFTPGQYTVKIKIPEPSQDPEFDRKRAEAGFLTQTLNVNQRLQLLGFDPIDEAEQKELTDYYSELTKVEQLIRPT